MAKLTRYVFLYDPHGNLIHLAPGDEAPEWAKSQLGKYMFTEDKNPEPKSVAEAIHNAPATNKAAGALAQGNPEVQEEAREVLQPKRGASAAQWRKFAKEAGVKVTAGMSRDEIIDACEAEGIEVE